MYTDEFVKQLPHVPSEHPQQKEWTLRQEATRNILDYLSKKAPKRILDLGCGNGWFTHQLVQHTDTQVLGVDVNRTELEQAARLFASDNCRFAYGDIFAAVWPKQYFDVIILNSCIQYFPKVGRLLRVLLAMLKEGGEIHIIDSPIYQPAEVPQARQRSQHYYQSKGVGAMAANYHHHSWEDFASFQPHIHYRPDQLLHKIRRKLFGKASPFPWIAITAR